MPKRAFLFTLIILIALVLITSPPLLKPFFPEVTQTPTATVVTPSATPSATSTPDPFAFVPTATPLGSGSEAAIAFVAPALPTPMLGELPPTYTPTPSATAASLENAAPAVVLPDSRQTTPQATKASREVDIPVPPTPNSAPPTRLLIPRLGLDAPVEAVGMLPSDAAPGVFEWDVPAYRAAGWLNTSAPLGQPGNTVLDGHHNVQGEVFRDLWMLEPGDEITLSAGSQTRRYLVSEVLVLPEKNQALEIRLQNASYIQPSEDERLTLITCWPYENNTHRTVVVALPAPAQTQEVN